MSEDDLSRFLEDSDEDEDDSSTSSCSPDYISYKTRPEWSDVTPLSIKSQTPIMDIKYTPHYEEAFSYFRAMLARGELSERSLALTADCIELQRSNFSVWYFRRRILKKFPQHLKNELSYVEKIIGNEPKNYQVWHHRKTIVEWLQDGSHDKQLTASVLTIDNKNYHAWQHRQWFIREFGQMKGELEFTDEQLAMDMRNNSAWNHRFYVIKETRLHENKAHLQDELVFVHKMIEQLPSNESSWSYLRGILLLAFDGLTSHRQTQELCENLYHQKGCRSPHLLAFIIDSIEEQLVSPSPQDNKQDLKMKAQELCHYLSDTDKVRSKYWNLLSTRISKIE